MIIYEKEEGLVSWHQTCTVIIMPCIGETPAAAKDAKNIQWDEGESKNLDMLVLAYLLNFGVNSYLTKNYSLNMI